MQRTQYNTEPTLTYENKTRKRLLNGVLALTISNMAVKILGMLLKIPLTNRIGEEGMAYYNLAYNIFKWFYMISTAGLPVAISILISASRTKRREREVRRIDRTALLLFLTIGLLCTGAMLFLSNRFAVLQGAPDAKYCMMLIAPSLLFICISSCMRGYFQGFEELIPTAISQMIEALAKLGLGLALAWYAMDVLCLPLYWVAAFAIAGSSIGTLFSMIFVIIAKTRFCPIYDPTQNRSDNAASKKTITKKLIAIALPVTISASVMSLTDLIDSVLIINRLCDAGFSHDMALKLYGNYTSLAVPMYNLPLALIYPVCGALVPSISGAVAAMDSQKRERLIDRLFSTVSVIAIPCTVGLSVLCEPVLALLYRADIAKTGAPLLAILSMSVLFVSFVSVTNSVLQAVGQERKPIISMLIGAVVKVILDLILCGTPSIGILGAPISTSVCYLCIMLINLGFVYQKSALRFSFGRVFTKPLIASTGCAMTAILTYRFFAGVCGESRFIVLPAILCAGVVYLLLLLLMHGIEPGMLTSFFPKRSK